MHKLHLESINKTIEFEGAIEEKDLFDINLSLLSYSDLKLLYSEVVGYAENLVEFEFEARFD